MVRNLLLSVAVICGLVSAAGVAQAQSSFSFAIGGGHHHHGHHHGHHHHHHCWDDYWCGPHFGYTWYAPPPVRERVIYVQPARTEVWETRVGSVPSASSVPSLSSAPSATGDTRLTIRNSAGHKTPVNFLIDRREASLSDGETRTWSGPSRRSVQFDRGGTFGTAEYDLAAGDYEFVVTAAGWDLVKKDSEAARTASVTTPRKNTLPVTTLR